MQATADSTIIEIKNLRTHSVTNEFDIRVDRSSVLGNPFFMSSEAIRDLTCDKYEEWIRQQIADNNRLVCNELNRLFRIIKKHGKLNLFCWCAPKRCHAETIRTLLYEKL